MSFYKIKVQTQTAFKPVTSFCLQHLKNIKSSNLLSCISLNMSFKNLLLHQRKVFQFKICLIRICLSKEGISLRGDYPIEFTGHHGAFVLSFSPGIKKVSIQKKCRPCSKHWLRNETKLYRTLINKDPCWKTHFIVLSPKNSV